MFKVWASPNPSQGGEFLPHKELGECLIITYNIYFSYRRCPQAPSLGGGWGEALNLLNKSLQRETVELEYGALGYLCNGEAIGQYLVADVCLVLLDGGIAILVA